MPLILPHGFLGQQGAATGAPKALVFSPTGVSTEAFLRRTDSSLSPTNPDLCTISVWIYMDPNAVILASPLLKFSGVDANGVDLFQVSPGDYIMEWSNSFGDNWSLESTNVISISSPVWRHFVWRYDSTQGTADNRVRLYMDGSLVADTGTEPGSGRDQTLWDNGTMVVGIDEGLQNDTYRMAFIDVVDGQSLDPTSFAQDASGTWTAIKYAGSYGNLGFRLDGTLGDARFDASGNNNHFITNSGVTLDDSNMPPRNF